MPKFSEPDFSRQSMDILSTLLLAPQAAEYSELQGEVLEKVSALQTMTAEQFSAFLAIAHSNHVVVRVMELYRRLMLDANDLAAVQAADEALAQERSRIAHATACLHEICDAFEKAGLDLIVIKTLDHWPDFGSDIDLYTGADPDLVCSFMQKRFGAVTAARSWGDRLAGKWNFDIPGLPESVEIHMCRLGQTGEQLALAANVPARARVLPFGEYQFRVPSPSDRIMISTLQRMYRHFYFRLCDILDSAGLVTSGELDFMDLKRSAEVCGIWEGVATYLVLVSDYVQSHGGDPLALPAFVRSAARFDGAVMYCGGSFLRVPILPQSAGLYRSQLFGLLRKGELHCSARLGVLPWLATAAAIGYKITGSDKGIW